MADTVNPNPEQVSEAAIPSTGKKRITAEAAKALQDYYASQKWGQNQKMPGNNVDKGLDDIIQRFGLERKQAAYQLLKWKKNTYDFYSWVPNHSEDHMTMENDEFVMFTLLNMIPQVDCDEGCTSKSLYQLGSITAFGFGNKNNCKILISIVECKDDFLPMFSIVVNHYSVLVSKHFPKVAEMIPGSSLAFAKDRNQLASGDWVTCFLATISGKKETHATTKWDPILQQMSTDDWKETFIAVE